MNDLPLISYIMNASKMRIVIAFYFEGHPANINKTRKNTIHTQYCGNSYAHTHTLSDTYTIHTHRISHHARSRSTKYPFISHRLLTLSMCDKLGYARVIVAQMYTIIWTLSSQHLRSRFIRAHTHANVKLLRAADGLKSI